jgi:hypothetical protein
MNAILRTGSSDRVRASFPPAAFGSRISLFVLALLLACFLPACKPKELQALLEPSEAMSSVLAEEAVQLAGSKTRIALIIPDASWGPPSTVEGSLKAALKKRGVTVVIAKAANVGNPMFSGEVGLKAADFFEAMEAAAGAGAVISLVGAPRLNPSDAARLRADHPPVLIVATAMMGNKMGVRTDHAQLARLLEGRVIQLAIVDGGTPAVSASNKSDATRSLFAQNYRILRRAD